MYPIFYKAIIYSSSEPVSFVHTVRVYLSLLLITQMVDSVPDGGFALTVAHPGKRENGIMHRFDNLNSTSSADIVTKYSEKV